MRWLFFKGALAACLLSLLSASIASAALVVAGSLQTEQGDPDDWAPSTSSLVMTESPAGVHKVTANNLVDGEFYEFKVLDDEGTAPANWGDPETVPVNTMAYGDSDGTIEITVDTNNNNVNGNATVWVNTDNAYLQVVGDFMDEAGGTNGDWSNANDATFAMTPQGSGYYTYTAVISTMGNYEFKALNGNGSWNYQLGWDGFSQNAGSVPFSTTTDSQEVTLFVDLAGQEIGVEVIPEPTAVVLCLSAAGCGLIRRRR